MIKSFNGKTPQIPDSAYISQTATIIGDVQLGENVSIWPGAVIRADFGKITIGNNSAIEDNCVIHTGSPVTIFCNVDIGRDVHIGHGAVLNCRSIGNNVLIGMNATILHDVEIGNFCIIGASCLVRQDMKIPDYSFVTGVPGNIKSKVAGDQLFWLEKAGDIYVDLIKQYKEQGI